MSKSEPKKYELIVVYSPVLNDAQLKDEVKKVRDVLTANAGRDINAELWGKRELSFRMKKQRFGHYVCYTFATDSSVLINEIQRVLGISDSVLRFQSHRVSDKVRKFKGSIRANAENDFDSDTRFEAELA